MKRRERLRRRQSLRPRPDRRGVLLLVVLSMLVLFLLLGTTFLVTSGQYRTASKVVEKANRTTFQPADLLERALMQLLRDTGSQQSVIRHHSLLRDLYGADGFVARVYAQPTHPNLVGFRTAPRFAGVDPTIAPSAANQFGRGPSHGQIVEFYVEDKVDLSETPRATLNDKNAVGLDLDTNGLPVEHELSTIDGYYEGRLLTMLSGPCRGQSVRVVDYDCVFRDVNDNVQANNPIDDIITVVARFRVIAPTRMDGQALALGPLPANTNQTVLTDFVESATLGHRFIVNGAPFNGAGVGYNELALSSHLENAPSPRLSAVEKVGFGAYGVEVALAPNAMHFARDMVAALTPNALRPNAYLDPFAEGNLPAEFVDLNAGRDTPLYGDFVGPGDTDESYDAPDNQNMALASQAMQPRLRGRVAYHDAAQQGVVSQDPDLYYSANTAAPAYLDLEGVTIPSFHRPALANFWFHRLWRSQWLRGLVPDDNNRVRAILEPYDANGAPRFGMAIADARQIVALKRKFLMRPLRSDHPSFDGSNPLSRYGSGTLRTALDGGNLVNTKGTPATVDDEITFPYWEAVGPWDVDNDGDGVNDSVWVDIGLPVQQTEDGRWYKPLVAMLVEDLDGRLNLNAHGSESDLAVELLDPSNDTATYVSANLPMDTSQLSAAIADATGNASRPADLSWLRTSDQLPQGAGWGVAEVSLRSLLSPTMPRDAANQTEQLVAAGNVLNDPPLALGFFGNPQYDDAARVYYGRPDPAVAGRNAAPALRVSETFGRYGSVGGSNATVALTSPGRTFVATPNLFPSTRDARTPLEFLGYPTYTGAANIPRNEARSGFASPPDLRSRFAVGLTAAGGTLAEPAYEANSYSVPGLTWREFVAAAPDDSPYELDLSVEARRLAPVSVAAVQRSYDSNNDGAIDANAAPLVDDAPFSPAELERILRALDGDAEALPDRLWNLVDAFDPTKLAAQQVLGRQVRQGAANPDPAAFNVSSLENAVASSRAAINRRLVTTDSWDLPAPNENWTDRLILGADGLPGVPYRDGNVDASGAVIEDFNGLRNTGDRGDDDNDGLFDEGDEAITTYDAGQLTAYQALFQNGCDDYIVVMQRPVPKNAKLVDYLRYRIVLELANKGVVNLFTPRNPVQLAQFHRELDQVVNGILYGASRPASAVRSRVAALDTTPINVMASPALFSFGGLVAPEVLAGRRMDLNRPFGDGRDNNGNGVVDEPQEAGEPYTYTVAGGSVEVATYDETNKNADFDQDLNDNGVLYIDTDGDGEPDRFDPGDLADPDGDGVLEPLVDNLWIDDDGDGVRDANEFRPFDYTRGADANGRGAYVNAVGGAGYDVGDPLVKDDGVMARQLFARHLYCLMLALMDENYLAPYDTNDPQVRHYLDPLSGVGLYGSITADSSVAYQIAAERFAVEFATELGAGSLNVLLQGGSTAPFSANQHTHADRLSDAAFELRRFGVLNDARRMAMRKLTCRQIAQWAVNVVDFRDPDAIQTPFEYDENPWDGWNVAADNVLLPLDGDLATDENFTQARVINAANFGQTTAPDPGAVRFTQQSRGVVWGAERPEVVLTEGLAWHDRRVEDLPSTNQSGPAAVYDGGQLAGAGGGGAGTNSNKDDDFDQLRKPKGFTYLEATNPWVGDATPPAELYSSVDRNSPLGAAAATLEEGLVFDRLSNDAADPTNPTQTRSPVWRVICVEEHPLLRNATVQPQGGTANSLLSQEASDDPPTQLNKSAYPGNAPAAGQNSTTSLEGQPFAYKALERDPSNVNAGRLLAYYDFWVEHRYGAIAALLTGTNNVRDAVGDADGVLVTTGAIEAPPTAPDPSFPTFDPKAQPRWGATPQATVPLIAPATITIPSGVAEGPQGGPLTKTYKRSILEKPVRFIERAFYLVSPKARNASTYTPSPPPPAGPSDRDPNNLDGSISGSSADPRPDLVDPGYHIPDLRYTIKQVDGITAEKWPSLRKMERENGVSSEFDNGLRGNSYSLTVRASKFAALNLTAPDDPTIDTDDLDRLNPVPIAPLLPGRRAVIGTAGAVYTTKTETPPASPTFFGPDAADVYGRFTTITSRLSDRASTFSPKDLRRFEMIPSDNPNKHQFAVRMNGGTESTQVVAPGQPSSLPSVGAMKINISAGEGFGTDGFAGNGDDLDGYKAGQPVIVVPMAGFSISEPLDQYLVRQVELDRAPEGVPNPALPLGPTASVDWSQYRQYSPHAIGSGPVDAPGGDLGQRGKNDASAEGGFVASDGQPLWFDEPFDVLPELVENQTTPNYRSMHLERLANPLLPWNPPPLRPGGVVDEQHDPALAVNPYLPADTMPMDLTAFNSLTDAEGQGLTTPPGTWNGPEMRHFRSRPMDNTMETVIGFLSIERSRTLGPFPILWAYETGRLLWRQARGSTLSEWAHTRAASGYRANGTFAPGGDIPNDEARSLTEYDRQFTGGGAWTPRVVAPAWQMSLGFADRLWGEFYTGSGLDWAADTVAETVAAQTIDLDGDSQAGDLLGNPEITNPAGVNEHLLAANGRPADPTATANNATTPSLPWPNRPFASAGELLQVPTWGGTRMLTYHSVFNWQHTQSPEFEHSTQVNPYNGEDGGYNLSSGSVGVDHDGVDYNIENIENTAEASRFDGDFGNDFDYTDADNDGFDDTSGQRDVDRDLFPEATSTNRLRWRETRGHFGHLANFFQTARFPASVLEYFRRVNNATTPGDTSDDTIEPDLVPRGASHFYRLLDYVTVPSRYTATQTLLSPDVFGAAGLGVDDPRAELSAPFNQVDRYREPGRVNLNTIVGRRDAQEPARIDPVNGAGPSDSGYEANRSLPRLPDYWSEVYDGLMHRVQDGSLTSGDNLLRMGHLGPAWRDVALSRRGYVQPGFDPTVLPTDLSRSLGTPQQNQVDYAPLRMHPDFPTFFANPFRAPGEGANVPLAHMVQTGVDATLLRAHPLSPGADGAWGRRGEDDRVVDKSETSNSVADDNNLIDDAAEAGVLPMQLGGGFVANAPTQPILDRLSADVVLARFRYGADRVQTLSGPERLGASKLRAALPDSLLDAAFRPTLDDLVNPRDVPPRQSVANFVHNAEISKRATAVPLFSGATLEPALDTERNSATRYLPIQRLSNLATTRSNVYAVWITVGFFEVKQATEAIPALSDSSSSSNGRYFLQNGQFKSIELQEEFFRVYPDGWTLGAELGVDTGEDRRHRGFYMIDRSRPVAFRPGEDLNVSDTVLLRRRIQ